jgi:hypothetical protein
MSLATNKLWWNNQVQGINFIVQFETQEYLKNNIKIIDDGLEAKINAYVENIWVIRAEVMSTRKTVGK